MELAGTIGVNWHGLIGPKGMSADIVAKLNKAVNETMGAKSMEANLESDGLTASPGSADFGAQLASESARWGAIVRSATSRPSSDRSSRKPHPIWAEGRFSLKSVCRENGR